MHRAASTVLLFFMVAGFSHGENWPAWRGPLANGVSGERDLPTSWGPAQNVRWKVSLPATGNSTPIIWGDRVFITQALDGGKRRAVVAFDRTTGKQLWQQELPCAAVETTHPQNPPCSGSPITDGKAVYAHLASAGVVAYDLDGKKLWHRDFGPLLHKWGNGSSPILYKDLLIVWHGPGEPSFLTALNKVTGETVWKKEETAINSPIFGSWSTPVLVQAGQRDELVFPLPGAKIGGDGEFKAYDPATGNELWRCSGLGNEVYAMPVVSANGDVIVGISGHNAATMAVRPGGQGDVTATHRLWRVAGKNPQRIGSGIIHNGHLYIADADGFAECLEAATGKVVWKERLGGKLWGSLLLADGKLYVSSLEGQTYIVDASPTFKLLAKNDLAEPIYAAPAVAHGNLFIRTWQHLYCIGPNK